MTRKKVVLAYVVFALIYFIVANMLFESDVKKGQNVLVQILASLGNAFYWVQVFFLFLLVLLVTSAIGYLVYRKDKRLRNLFLGIGLGSVALFLTSVILSYF